MPVHGEYGESLGLKLDWQCTISHQWNGIRSTPDSPQIRQNPTTDPSFKSPNAESRTTLNSPTFVHKRPVYGTTTGGLAVSNLIFPFALSVRITLASVVTRIIVPWVLSDGRVLGTLWNVVHLSHHKYGFTSQASRWLTCCACIGW